MNLKKMWKKIWHFIWEDNSIWSWLANVALAFVLIKFVVYPSLGFIFQTSHPVVAVVSESMEHRTNKICVRGNANDFLWMHFKGCSQHAYTICGKSYKEFEFFSFDEYWIECGSWYSNSNITKEEFGQFSFKNGFNKGDIMVLRGKNPSDIKVGNVIVFWSIKREPIIHRVVKKWKESDGYHFQTKGDNNERTIKDIGLDETNISEEQVIGKAILRIPLLGYIKIAFVNLLGVLGVNL